VSRGSFAGFWKVVEYSRWHLEVHAGGMDSGQGLWVLCVLFICPRFPGIPVLPVFFNWLRGWRSGVSGGGGGLIFRVPDDTVLMAGNIFAGVLGSG